MIARLFCWMGFHLIYESGFEAAFRWHCKRCKWQNGEE